MTGVAASQGLYFLIFGVWPVIHMRSFLLVTGPKIDLWLVKTTGLLIASIGFALLMAAWSEDIDQTAVTLSIASAAVLAAVDVIYVYKGVLAPIYLADAAVEVGLLVWGMSALAAR